MISQIKRILLILTAFALSVCLLSGCTGDEMDDSLVTKNTTVSTADTVGSTTSSHVTTSDVNDMTSSGDSVTGTETPTGGLDDLGSDISSMMDSDTAGTMDTDSGRDALNGDSVNGDGMQNGME